MWTIRQSYFSQGVPGTGLSYRETLMDRSEPGRSEPTGGDLYHGKPWRRVLWMVLIALVLYLVFG